jgi:ABC-type nickel/cobalt efflux system permease component RcnA
LEATVGAVSRDQRAPIDGFKQITIFEALIAAAFRTAAASLTPGCSFLPLSFRGALHGLEPGHSKTMSTS